MTAESLLVPFDSLSSPSASSVSGLRIRVAPVIDAYCGTLEEMMATHPLAKVEVRGDDDERR